MSGEPLGHRKKGEGRRKILVGWGRAAQESIKCLNLRLSQCHHPAKRCPAPAQPHCTRGVWTSGRWRSGLLGCGGGPASWRSACTQQRSCWSKCSEAGDQGAAPITPTWQRLTPLVASMFFGLFCFASFPPWVCPYLQYLWACTLGRFSHVQFFVILWTEACQAPLSMGFSRQEYWSGLPCPLAGDLPNPGTEPASSVLQTCLVSLPLSQWGSTYNTF